MSILSRLLGPYAKTVTALISYGIAFVVQQEQLPHPFTGSWWVGLLTGAGVVLGVFGVPNMTSPSAPANPPANPPAIG